MKKTPPLPRYLSLSALTLALAAMMSMNELKGVKRLN